MLEQDELIYVPGVWKMQRVRHSVYSYAAGRFWPDDPDVYTGLDPFQVHNVPGTL